MSNEELEKRIAALESVQRDSTAQQRRLGTQVQQTPDKYTPPALGTWIVTRVAYNAAYTVPAAADDWENPATNDAIFSSLKSQPYRHRYAVPTRTAELNAICQALAGTWATAAPYYRYYTAFDNNGPGYTAKAGLQSNIYGNVGVKLNGKFTDYTADATFDLDIRPGRNKLSVQIKAQTSAVESAGAVQLYGTIFEPDQCKWAIGFIPGFFSERTGDDTSDGGGGGGGGEVIIILPGH